MSTHDASLHEKTAPKLRRFNQAHPGIKWFLSLNLIVAPALIFTAMQIATALTPPISKTLLIASGAKAVPADSLVQSVANEGKTVFWLDRLSGDTYSHSSIQDGVDVVSYLPESFNPAHASTPDFVVTTYANSKIFNSQMRPLHATKDSTVDLYGQVEVVYNANATNQVTVIFRNKPEIAVINYPGNRAISTLVNDAQNLIPIK